VLLVRHAVMGGVLASLPGLLVDTRLMTAVIELRVERRDDGWVLTGADSDDVWLVNDFLGYLGDRHYAPGTRRVIGSGKPIARCQSPGRCP
jgi:hypothetical protein